MPRRIADTKEFQLKPAYWVFFPIALILTLIVFDPGSNSDFANDSEAIVQRNVRVIDADWREIWTTGWWDFDSVAASHAADIHDSLYRPLTMSWFALLASTRSGESSTLEAKPFRYGNLFLHWLNACLRFFLVLSLLRGKPWSTVFAWSIALAGLVHGLSAEAVASIVGAAELLASLFLSASWLAFIHAQRGLYADGEKSQTSSWLWLGTAALCWGLSLLSKETAVFFPLLLFLQSWRGIALKKDQGSFSCAFISMLPFVAVLLGWLALRYQVLDIFLHQKESGVYLGFSVSERLRSALAVLPSVYGQAFLWPFDLSPNITHQDFATPTSFFDLRVLIGLSGIVALLAIMIRGLIKRSVIALGACLALLTFLPVSNLFFGIGAIAAYRFSYTPMFGVLILFGVGLNLVWQRRWKYAHYLALPILAWALCGAVGSYVLTEKWQDSAALYSYTRQIAPNNLWALRNDIGYKHLSGQQETNFDDMFLDFAKFDEIEPHLQPLPGESKLNHIDRLHCHAILENWSSALASFASDQQDLETALNLFAKAGRTAQRAERYAQGDGVLVLVSRLKLIRVQIEELRMSRQRPGWTGEEDQLLLDLLEITVARTEADIDQETPVNKRQEFHLAAAAAALMGKDKVRAQTHFDLALEIDPKDPQTRLQLAQFALADGRMGVAIGHLEESVRLKNATIQHYYTLASLLAKRGQRGRGLTILQTILKMRPTSFIEVELQKQAAAQLRAASVQPGVR